ncbi:MAG: (2Fe-2S)-binding protein [Hyphomicrobiales bacterium]|nr:(2Fe-2S)-binding protein [Hyphomicrobiales bacterium]
MSYTLTVNGRERSVESSDPGQPLLYVLRNALGFMGPKFGCGLGQCGACTVIADGAPIRSCQLPISAAQGLKITTIEGLGTTEKPHPVQAAFIAEAAAQCGYCTNGMVMTSAALIAQNPKPGLDEIKQALAGNLCRCGTHDRVLRAVLRATGRQKT